jgi:hypothetical protein
LALQCKIPITQILAIVKIIASTLAPFVSNCELNQCHGYWLLNDALANVINICVKLMNEILDWKYK